jgi:purine-cytosine permease-like protein
VTGATRFFALAFLALVAGGLLGWFAIRKDLFGLSLGVLILCAPTMLLAVAVGARQVRREARDGQAGDNA